MITAIYIERSDGDFDFFSAFDAEHENAPNWIGELVEYLKNEDETVRIQSFTGTSELVDVLEKRKRLAEIRHVGRRTHAVFIDGKEQYRSRSSMSTDLTSLQDCRRWLESRVDFQRGDLMLKK